MSETVVEARPTDDERDALIVRRADLVRNVFLILALVILFIGLLSFFFPSTAPASSNPHSFLGAGRTYFLHPDTALWIMGMLVFAGGGAQIFRSVCSTDRDNARGVWAMICGALMLALGGFSVGASALSCGC